jgi:L-ascorbate metabolism protein UlaG (beta-lactamase superfamily)
MTSKNNEPFIVKGAGEYEVSDIFIKGYGIKNKIAEKEYMTTSYTFSLDGIKIAFFAQISKGDELSNEAYEDFLQSDIIFLPIGGGDMFTPKEAASFAKKFNPKIIIPTSYGDDELAEFLNIFSSEAKEEEKITIKMKDIEEKTNDVVLLKDLSK